MQNILALVAMLGGVRLEEPILAEESDTKTVLQPGVCFVTYCAKSGFRMLPMVWAAFFISSINGKKAPQQFHREAFYLADYFNSYGYTHQSPTTQAGQGLLN